ncbi:AbrB/MazE/SpoVT family DNA-binding domain-containing protein [Luteolibacter sp. LG18]|uniref:AbrB/MazE/SpoVT family DNA-binding domain-containing protein n=1 Tax=Luteolibacter sp. LG18 TaxID=2819286 RepID=UPI002B313BCA|nr:AbrB family transcriptional regulator [Luteolibacter sp. LG18]
MKTTVSEKGQVTIPKALRDRLGLAPGVVLDFHEENGRLVAEKRADADPFAKWSGKGKLPAGIASVDDYLHQIRER